MTWSSQHVPVKAVQLFPDRCEPSEKRWIEEEGDRKIINEAALLLTYFRPNRNQSNDQFSD
jgi:hypothetical protein